VSFCDLFDELSLSGCWVLEVEIKKFDDVMGGDERCLRCGAEACLGDEQEREQAHGQVVMKCAPATHLVLGHADFAFCILEGSCGASR
jgi:hypothetical protein